MRRPAVYAVAALTVAILGTNWPIMSAGVEQMPPLWLATLRIGGAGILVSLVLGIRGQLRRPASQDRPIVLSIGLGHLALVTGLVFVALRFVPPGRSSILVYTSALWAAPLAAFVLHERLTRLRLTGLLVGGTGILLLLEPWSLDWGDAHLLWGIGMLMLAAIANAATAVHVRWHRWVGSAIQVMPWQFGIATVPLAVLAYTVEGPPSVTWSRATAAIVAYQVVLASGVGVWGLLTVGRNLPAITANLTVMAVPVIGLGTSVAFRGEPLTIGVVASLALVLTGVVAGLLSDRLTPEPVLTLD
jgi:drug/metabolite transporter (DMT)-like permease